MQRFKGTGTLQSLNITSGYSKPNYLLFTILFYVNFNNNFFILVLLILFIRHRDFRDSLIIKFTFEKEKTKDVKCLVGLSSVLDVIARHRNLSVNNSNFH